ncbi:MAG TPA: PhzF family phenazine biosynthesis protein [Steroidobacteraceae bacterium]|nr:PhzF family phenazine biosynthesis protein [Steroidobacteraceae bacterium]
MSRGLKFHTLDVFTERRFGGNPLAVFTDGADLPGEVMQQIAREMNLSETVFVMPPRDRQALCRLRIFQPAKELPFAGHPTVGSGYLLARLGRVPLRDGRVTIQLEEEVGLVPVSIESRGGMPGFVQLTAAALPSFRDPPADRATLAAMLRLSADDLLDDAQGVSCGLPHLFVPVRDRAVLARADIDVALWRATLGGYWAQQVFIFCRDPELPGSSIRARMYAPESGITEDPATGSACAALGGYLGARAPESDGTLRWVVEQGFEMGRPSLLHLEIDKSAGRITAVRVGGHSVLVSEGTLQID